MKPLSYDFDRNMFVAYDIILRYISAGKQDSTITQKIDHPMIIITKIIILINNVTSPTLNEHFSIKYINSLIT